MYFLKVVKCEVLRHLAWHLLLSQAFPEDAVSAGLQVHTQGENCKFFGA